jgi:hypothetical protein
MTISKSVLSKYKEKSNVFIETGTHIGLTTQVALDLGFNKIYTIELAEHFYKNAVKKFEKSPQVICIFGDSAHQLKNILGNLEESAVFWLDGHWSMGDTAKGDFAVPIYEELNIIMNSKIKNHTILIDDCRLMGDVEELVTEWSGISLDKIKDILYCINPKYKIYFEDGYIPNDILVAKL